MLCTSLLARKEEALDMEQERPVKEMVKGSQEGNISIEADYEKRNKRCNKYIPPQLSRFDM